MKFLKLIVFGIFSLGFLGLNLPESRAQEVPVLDFFHGRECPHCQREKAWFPELKKLYPDLVINEYEVWHDSENKKLWSDRLSEFGMAPRSVPTNIIGEEVVLGADAAGIISALEKTYGPPAGSPELRNEVVSSIDTVSIGNSENSETQEVSDDSKAQIIFIVVGALFIVGVAFFLGKKSE